MKAITTKFHGASNARGARYSASDSDGNRVITSIDHGFGSLANHTEAAVTLCRKMGMAWEDGQRRDQGRHGLLIRPRRRIDPRIGIAERTGYLNEFRPIVTKKEETNMKTLDSINTILDQYGADSEVGDLAKALAVMVLTPSIRAFIAETDPQALIQAEKAIARVASHAKEVS